MTAIKLLLLLLLTPLAVLAAAIIFGGPGTPAPMASINQPFKAVDFSGLPPLAHYRARDGAELAYRRYPAASAATGRGSVVLVHGSSASSNSMHVLAKAMAAAGFEALALDVRGHGASGRKGHIAYVGQVEDDLQDLVQQVQLPQPATLAGFSSGGGFVLRVAGSARQDAFARYLLLSPFIGVDAPSQRPDSGGWVSVGVPRIVALTLLHHLGIHALQDLTVVRFALDDAAKTFLTPEYSFALAASFQPLRDWKANIRAVHRPVAVVAGADDEAFRTAELKAMFKAAGQDWPVTLVPGISHIPLTLDARAVAAVVNSLEALTPSAQRGVVESKH